jgi:methyltransferase (TIGR00027 family)
MGNAVLRDVSDTALGVAVARAQETERPNALFRDPYARSLAGDRGQRIARATHNGLISTALAVRTAVFDELILRVLAGQRGARVLNLGAGLDTRPYRLPLPAELEWVEADLPAILDYKGRHLAAERPRCRLVRRGVDLTDPEARRALLDDFGTGRPTLVVCEGLVVYLSPENVTAMATDLADRPAFQWWLLDLVGPLFVRWGNRVIGRQLSAAGASFQFAPPQGAGFFQTLGWKPGEVRSLWLETRRLHREPWLMRAAWALTLPHLRQQYRDLDQIALLAHSPSTLRGG